MTDSRPISSPKVPGVALRRLSALLLWTLLTPVCLTAQENQSPAPPAEAVPPTPTQALELSDEVVRDVLTNFQRAIETRNFDRLLDTFDRESMKDFPEVREEFAAFFRLHDNIKFRYQLLQVSADKDAGFAIADVEMDPEPRDILPTEHRRSAQMRFELKRTPAGWRALGLKPMDFFTQ